MSVSLAVESAAGSFSLLSKIWPKSYFGLAASEKKITQLIVLTAYG